MKFSEGRLRGLLMTISPAEGFFQSSWSSLRLVSGLLRAEVIRWLFGLCGEMGTE
jgi:hypothetical protein